MYLTHKNKHREKAKMRQKNMFQRKGQNKMLEKELNQMETINLLDKEFKVMVINIFNELQRMDELSENFNKERKKYKKRTNQN